MVPPPDEAFDRVAILRRRAAFIASALSTLSASTTATGIARAQAAPAPESGVAAACERDPEDPESAAALALEAKELTERGKHAEAALLLEKIYRMVPAWPIARQRVQALAQSGDLEGAHRAGAQHLECVGESPELRAELAALELRGGRLIVLVRPSYGQYVIEVDGSPYGAARMEKGILLRGGKHSVALQGPSAGAKRDVEILVGETVTVELAGVPAMPCLSPCLSIYEPRPLVRMGAGPLVIVGVVPSDPLSIGIGGGARAAVSVFLAERSWFEGDVFGVAMAGEAGGVVAVGTTVEVRYSPVEVYSLGLGFSVGYLFGLADEPGYLRSSPFLGPVLIPASFKAGPASLDVRVPIWFSSTEQAGVTTARVGLVAPQVSLTFGGTVRERSD